MTNVTVAARNTSNLCKKLQMEYIGYLASIIIGLSLGLIGGGGAGIITIVCSPKRIV